MNILSCRSQNRCGEIVHAHYEIVKMCWKWRNTLNGNKEKIYEDKEEDLEDDEEEKKENGEFWSVRFAAK